MTGQGPGFAGQDTILVGQKKSKRKSKKVTRKKKVYVGYEFMFTFTFSRELKI